MKRNAVVLAAAFLRSTTKEGAPGLDSETWDISTLRRKMHRLRLGCDLCSLISDLCSLLLASQRLQRIGIRCAPRRNQRRHQSRTSQNKAGRNHCQGIRAH